MKRDRRQVFEVYLHRKSGWQAMCILSCIYALVQVPHPEDLDVKNCSSDCSCESNRGPNSVSMPICFLVREQAKSQVAIQDLQNRLSHVENVQVDVIDTLMQFRSYLCEAANSDVILSPDYLNSTNNPTVSSSVSKSNTTVYHSIYEPPRSILKTNSYPPKTNENISDEPHRTSSIVTIQDQPLKHFDSTKSKDSALESDKQDSGLDSDCREHIDGHTSIRFSNNLVSQEGNDQLLQLLDEISYRSECLQRHFTVADENTFQPDMKEDRVVSYAKLQSNSDSALKNVQCLEGKFVAIEASDNSSDRSKILKSADTSQDIGIQVAIPSVSQCNNSGFAGFFEGKSFSNKQTSVRGRVGKNIDGILVSTILKETNVVELQRQALIYLVDNAVLSTKLAESEQALSFKNVESYKVENSLKEEIRLLMMENRELRISFDEQKMETNVLKSRVAMLERVMQSMNVENQELNWQLGETLNLQQLSKKSMCNLSSSFSSCSPNSTRTARKSSSLSSQTCRNSHLNGLKSKLLSNTSNVLDVTVEELDDCPTEEIQVNRSKYRSGPIHSSTPFQKSKNNVIDSANTGLPATFHSLKKCLKTGHSLNSDSSSFKSAKSVRYSSDCDIPEACTRRHSISQDVCHEGLILPSGNVSKFPFNTILEKLKANSEYRLSRNVPQPKDSETSVSASDQEGENALNVSAAQGQLRSPTRDNGSPQLNGKSSSQTRKNRNIHQRIQNILDRIVAESEEAS